MVDDESEFRTLLKHVLGDEYEVLEASDGPGALEIAGSQKIHLIVLDVLLPGIDGIEVLSRLRVHHPEVPVILLTGVAAASTAVEAMKLGALDYLTKPVGNEELRSLIRDALARRIEQQPMQGPDCLILIVGTDLGVMGTLQVAMSMRFHVDAAWTLPEALKKLSTQSYAAVILDESLTPVDSTSFLRTLRARLPMCPLIVLAADREPWMTPEFGAIIIVVAKPYRLSDLVSHLMSMLPIEPHHRTSIRFNYVVSRAVDYLRDHYATTPTLAHLASVIGISRSHLAYLFRADLGVTLGEFLNKVRIEIAKHQLRNTDMKIESIAELLGFCDASHLSRVFKRHVRCRPGQYRRGLGRPMSPGGSLV